MRNFHRKESGLWAIALFISGILASFQFALAEISQLTSQHATLSSTFNGYVYPNPIRPFQHPVLVVEPGSSEKISAHIYDLSGSVVFQTRVDDHTLTSMNNALAYEVPVQADLKPGVYVGLLLGYQGDRINDRTTFRFSVVK